MRYKTFLIRIFIKTWLHPLDNKNVVVNIDDSSLEFDFEKHCYKLDNGIYRVEVSSKIKSNSPSAAYDEFLTVLLKALNLISGYFMQSLWRDDEISDYIIYDCTQKGPYRVFRYIFQHAQPSGHTFNSNQIEEINSIKINKSKLDDIDKALDYLRFGLRGKFGKETFLLFTSTLESLAGPIKVEVVCDKSKNHKKDKYGKKMPLVCPECNTVKKRDATNWENLEKYLVCEKGLSKEEYKRVKEIRSKLSHGGKKIDSDIEEEIKILIPKIKLSLRNYFRNVFDWKHNVVLEPYIFRHKDPLTIYGRYQTKFENKMIPGDLPHLLQTQTDLISYFTKNLNNFEEIEGK